jgi:hypothetical protein
MKLNIKITIIFISISVVATLGYFQFKNDPVEEILDILQYEEDLNHQKNLQKELAIMQTNDLLEQMKNTYPNFSDSMAILIKPSFDEYINTVVNSWETSEVVNIYRETLLSALSEEELIEAVEFYKTDKGKEILNAFNNASNKTITYIQDQAYKASIEANQKLLSDIKEAFSPKLKYYEVQ